MPHEHLGRVSERIPDPSSLGLSLGVLKFQLPDPVNSQPDVLEQTNPLELDTRIQALDDVLQPGDIFTEHS